MAKPGKVRRGLRLAAMIVVANLLALALLEGILWVAFLTTGDDLRVEPPMPLATLHDALCPTDSGKLKLCASGAEYGARARPFVFNREPSLPRVIVVGESFVNGLRIKEKEAWPARLAHYMGDGYEVLNFGVCGTEIASLEPLIEILPDLKPSLVILAVGNNEYTMSPYYGGLVGQYPEIFSAVAETLSTTQLYGALRRKLMLRASASAQEDGAASPGAGKYQIYVDSLHGRPPRNMHLFPDGLVDRDVAAYLERIKRLNERFFRVRYLRAVTYLREKGLRVVVATLPRRLRNPPLLSGLYSVNRDEVKSLVGFMRGDNIGVGSAVEVAKIRRLGEVAPRLAIAQYAVGNLLLSAGDRQGAIAAFRQAAQWDVLPDITPAINSTIREASRDYGVPLLDLARLTEVWVGNEAPQYNDQVHLSPAGADALAKIVAKYLKK